MIALRPEPPRAGSEVGIFLANFASVFALLTVVISIVLMTTRSTAEATPPPSGTRTALPTDAAGTLWLCRPGLIHDPCTGSLTTTVVEPDGKARIVHDRPAKNPPVDCFYVYPTASTQTGPNASLSVDAGVLAAAQLQVERFSQVCRVYAPIYRQLTITGLTQTGVLGTKPPPGTPPANFTEPYSDVSAAWTDYLANYNHGRGVILIGHSQGSFQLIQLVRQRIETDPRVLRRIVSAILPGGNVQVGSSGSSSSSTFGRLKPCRSVTQTHCVVAYSSFPSMPPPGATFGRTNGPISGAPSRAASPNASVMCTNPAALSGGTATFATYFPTAQNLLVGGTDQPKVTTAWVEYPRLLRGTCLNKAGASWLQVDNITKLGDHRPHPIEALGPGWGYHLDDINLPLGNLVHLVCQQSSAYLHKALTCPTP